MARKEKGLTPARFKKLLESEPEELSEADQLALLRHADQLYGEDGYQWMEIGRCVFHAVEATPGLSRKEREEQLSRGFDRLPYQTGMKAKRVYVKYQDSPEEVILYGLDLADRIGNRPKPERLALLKKYRTPRQARASLKPKPEKVAKHRVRLGNHDDLIGAFRSQSEEVVMACSDWAKRIRSVLKKNKPLTKDFEHEFDEDDELISGDSIILTVEDGCVVIELCCTRAEAKARSYGQMLCSEVFRRRFYQP